MSDYFVKLLMLGDSNVGKSSLIKRLFDHQMNPDIIPTIGLDFREKKFPRGEGDEHKTVRLQVWDTAGQEKFHTLTQSYYRSCQGIILVYDLTNKESFANVRYWAEQLHLHAPVDVKTYVVGNKADLPLKHVETNGDGGQKRAVNFDEGQELARELDMPFSETSAYSGVNVEDVFMELVDKVLASRLDSTAHLDSSLGGSMLRSGDQQGTCRGRGACSI
jgi:small GTP-binding protein